MNLEHVSFIPNYVGPCNHVMACPRIDDGADGLQIYLITSRGQLTTGAPPSWGLGEGLTTPRRKK